MRSQRGHLGGRIKPAAHFDRVDRRAQFDGRLAPRLGGAKLHDEVNHLVELERFQIAFPHRIGAARLFAYWPGPQANI